MLELTDDPTASELFLRVEFARRHRRSWIETKQAQDDTCQRIKARWKAVEARREEQLAGLSRNARVRKFGAR